MPHFDLTRPTGIDLGAASVSEQLADWPTHLQTLVALSAAVAFSAVLAYHPSTRRQLQTRADFEQPKTTVMYGVVGALVAHIVLKNPAMALVIFGIGGLMRFRTEVGEAKDTGRVILSAIVGICCGLQSYVIAALATAFAWVLIYYIETRVICSVCIVGLDAAQLPASSLAYRRLLEQSGCRVLGENFNAKQGSLELLFSAPNRQAAGDLERNARDLPSSVGGHPLWQIS